jgi:hypothetical protein
VILEYHAVVRRAVVLPLTLFVLAFGVDRVHAQNADWYKAKARGAGGGGTGGSAGASGGGGGRSSGSGGAWQAEGGSVYDDAPDDDAIGDMDPEHASKAPAHAAAPKAKPQLVIKGKKKQVSAKCENRDVAIAGELHTIELKGTCRSLLVTGAHHEVLVDEVESITVQGHDNIVIFWNGAGGKAPRIVETGRKNVVRRAERDGQ